MREKRKGMTLVEVIVAMAIFAIIIVMVFPALAVLNKNNTSSQEVLEATYYSQDVAERITSYSHREGATPEGLVSFLELDSDYVFVCSNYESGSKNFTCDATKDNFSVNVEVFSTSDSELLKRVVIVSENRQNESRSKVELVVRFI